jgi:hypothetical protein
MSHWRARTCVCVCELQQWSLKVLFGVQGLPLICLQLSTDAWRWLEIGIDAVYLVQERSFNEAVSSTSRRQNHRCHPCIITISEVIRVIVGRDSSVGIATRWTIRGSNPGGGEVFAPVQTDPPPLLDNGSWSFSGGGGSGLQGVLLGEIFRVIYVDRSAGLSYRSGASAQL